MGKLFSFDKCLLDKMAMVYNDLLHPRKEEEARIHKKKRLVQSPNSYFMDVKCPGCYKIKTVFSHAQVPSVCTGCHMVLCRPTGGKARLTQGCQFRQVNSFSGRHSSRTQLTYCHHDCSIKVCGIKA